MTTSLPNHPRVARGGRRVGEADLLVIQRACQLIDDLGGELDRRLAAETRPAERMRMLRETTNRITRTANDAIQAYGRARRAVDVQIARTDDQADGALATLDRLRAARLDLLRALEHASHRYPPAPGGEAQPSAATGPDKV